MLRKSLTISSLIGLLLSVGLWGVSYWNLSWLSSDNHINVWIGRGGFHLGISDGYSRLPGRRNFRISGPRGLSARWLPVIKRYSIEHTTYFLPLWVPTLVFAFTFWLSYTPLHRRRKRKKLGLCVKCGYDLRGSKERCPECGSTI